MADRSDAPEPVTPVVNTAELLRGDQLLARIAPGAKLWVDPNTCVVQFGEGDACAPSRFFLPPDGGMWLTAPDSQCCYAIYRGDLDMDFGMARLGICSMGDCPDRSFQFGANGHFAVHLAHIIGIGSLLPGNPPEGTEPPVEARYLERMDLPAVSRLLEKWLRPAMVRAVSRVNGPGEWRYENLCPHMPELSQACWEEFFHVFFEHGLLLPRQKFQLSGINAPATPR